MERLGEKLKNAIILSCQDVRLLKIQIKEKYRLYSTQDRAAFLSRSIHDILDRHLSGIPKEDAEKIKKKLLSDTFISEEKDLSKFDILLSIFSLPHTESDAMQLALKWLSKNENIIVSEDQLENIINSDETKSAQPIHLSKKLRLSVLLTASLLALILLGGKGLNTPHKETSNLILHDKLQIIDSAITHPIITSKINPFPYQRINTLALKNYLINERQALIGESPYFNQIMIKAQYNDIDPLLLFAIIGQEQGFVPKDSEYSSTIINNPFNVFYSWENYNTTLEDSTQIAINTIKKSLQNHQTQDNVFIHLNQTYAEDQNWSQGVELIYHQLSRICAVDEPQPFEVASDQLILSHLDLETNNKK